MRSEAMNDGRNGRLLVFDSGIGGLGVVQEARRLVPDAGITYLADNAGFPYGAKSDDVLIPRIEALIGAAVEEFAPDVVVIACNTASTIALTRLRQRFAVPFVGCVPAVKPAAASSRNRAVGLLATPATIGRVYVRELIEKFAADCRVFSHGATNLADLAERRFLGHAVTADEVRAELAGLFIQTDAAHIDTIILGCTHYRFLLPELRAAAPDHISWLDPAEAVARQAGVVLRQTARAALPQPDVALFTGALSDQAAMESRLQDFGFASVRPFAAAAPVYSLSLEGRGLG